jgi:hypothetical protein
MTMLHALLQGQAIWNVSDPGDIVFNRFHGTRMTGVAAHLCAVMSGHRPVAI